MECSALITIRRIELADPLYTSERALRERVLFKPLGLSMARFEAEFPGVEQRYEHFVAVMDHPTGPLVIGCAGLLVGEPGPNEGRLLQMAVDPQRQGEGIGRRLVVAIESRAFGVKDLRRLSCHAREPVAAFYRGLGWHNQGAPFDEIGIPHRLLVLDRPTTPPVRPR